MYQQSTIYKREYGGTRTPSIKRMGIRERRGRIRAIGTTRAWDQQQTRPADFKEALKSPSFKTELPTFLLNEWKEQAYAHIKHERHMYVGHLGECLHFLVEDGVVMHDTIDVLGCNHAEAYTRISLHTKAIDDVENANNIIIRASDTDIAVIMLHHACKFSATLWMDTGTTNGKNRRYVNLSAIAMSIGSKMCQALPAYHAFTGTDCTSAIIRIISVLF